MLSTAIEKAGTLDSEKVKHVFLTHEFKGAVMGDVKSGADGIAFYVSTGISGGTEDKGSFIHS